MRVVIPWSILSCYYEAIKSESRPWGTSGDKLDRPACLVPSHLMRLRLVTRLRV